MGWHCWWWLQVSVDSRLGSFPRVLSKDLEQTDRNSTPSLHSNQRHHTEVIPSQPSSANNNTDHESAISAFDNYSRQPVLVGCIDATPSDEKLWQYYPHYTPLQREEIHLQWCRCHALHLRCCLEFALMQPAPPRYLTRTADEYWGTAKE